MMSAFFHFQHTLNRLFNNCIKKSGLITVKGKQLNGSKNWSCVVYQTRKFSARKTKIVNCRDRTLIQLKIITRQAV